MKNNMNQIRTKIIDAGYTICDSWKEINYYDETIYRIEVRKNNDETSIPIPELEKDILRLLDYRDKIYIDTV